MDVDVPRFDVCIVGAGPAGLTALSAMIEPYSLDDLSEQAGDRAAHALHVKQQQPKLRICVVDPEPWMTTWRKRFTALEIQWLRSPTMAHPDTFDKRSLLAFEGREKREHELMESSLVNSHVVSSEEANAGLRNLSSSQLFDDFCDDLVSRLSHKFCYGSATSAEGCDGNFHISLEDGRKIMADTVVLGVRVPGPVAIPSILANIPSTVTFHTDSKLGSRLAEQSTTATLCLSLEVG